MIVAFPGAIGAGLAPGMTDLDAGDRPGLAHLSDDRRQRLGLRVVPKTEAAGRDPSLRRDAGRLDHDEAGTAPRQPGEMRAMPIIREAVLGGVLAHRRGNDAIAKGDVFQAERVEQTRHSELHFGKFDNSIVRYFSNFGNIKTL